jgi:hypothetical protein
MASLRGMSITGILDDNGRSNTDIRQIQIAAGGQEKEGPAMSRTFRSAISAAGSSNVLDRCTGWRSAIVVSRSSHIPCPWRDRPYHSVPPRCGGPSLRSRDVRQPCCVLRVTYQASFWLFAPSFGQTSGELIVPATWCPEAKISGPSVPIAPPDIAEVCIGLASARAGGLLRSAPASSDFQREQFSTACG